MPGTEHGQQAPAETVRDWTLSSRGRPALKRAALKASGDRIMAGWPLPGSGLLEKQLSSLGKACLQAPSKDAEFVGDGRRDRTKKLGSCTRERPA